MYLVVTKRLDGETLLAGPYKTALGARQAAGRRRWKDARISWVAIIERGKLVADIIWVIRGTFDAAMVPAWECKPQAEVAADWQDAIINFSDGA